MRVGNYILQTRKCGKIRISIKSEVCPCVKLGGKDGNKNFVEEDDEPQVG